jgi:RNA polymerase sigma-70 factor (ECF subfamily)
MNDEQLIAQLQEGSRHSLDELYRRYSRPLFVFIRHSLQAEDPEDIVHDVFMRVIEKAHRFNPKKASFRTWLFAIARNRCIDVLRRQQKVRFLPMEKNIGMDGKESSLSLGNVLADDNPRTSDSSSKAAVAQAVNECIGALQKLDEKQAVVLYYTAGKVYREIGEIIGKSISMVKKHITAAQEKIRKCLEKKGIGNQSAGRGEKNEPKNV